MNALLLVLLAGVAFLTAYFTYGRWVGRRVFQLREDTPTPAVLLNDNRDYCPTRRSIVFGHHFTSIAGTGPIVGPAIAVMWGWLPAILWVVIGSIFIGAVHDFGSLVVSLRNKGRTIGDIAGDLLGPRVRLIFLGVLVLGLWLVLAIFGLVIAAVMRQYPASIFPVLVQIPLAVLIGVTVHRRGGSILVPSTIALVLMYLSVFYGDWGPLHSFNALLAAQPTWMWVVGLLAYSYVASVLPVWTLLQPRDYINSLQLLSAMGLLVAGLVGAATIGGVGDVTQTRSSTGQTIREVERVPLEIVAPRIDLHPAGAPPMFPILFITIACGAISGFHCLVASGTTSKQIRSEKDAQPIGYGSMLTEGLLATLVIVSCVAGIGLGTSREFDFMNSFTARGAKSEMDTIWIGDEEAYAVTVRAYESDSRGDGEVKRSSETPSATELSVSRIASGGVLDAHIWDANYDRFPHLRYRLINTWERNGDDARQWVVTPSGSVRLDSDRHGYDLRGELAWRKQYESWGAAGSLGSKVGAFVDGAANLIKSIGVPAGVAVALMGVLVASFAGTTMDTACRLQRYVIQELSRTFLPRVNAGACPRCGYDMRGLEGGRRQGGKASGEEGIEASREEGSGEHGGTRSGEENASQSDPLSSSVFSAKASAHGDGEADRVMTCPECGSSVTPVRVGAAIATQRRLARVWNPFRWLATMHGATLFAVVTAAALAAVPAPGQPFSLAAAGEGGLILWPLFGATNQLLGGLAFLVIAAWLMATKRPWWFLAAPTALMVVLPAWALVWQIFVGNGDNPAWIADGRWLLVTIGGVCLALEAWLVGETLLRFGKGVHLSESQQDADGFDDGPEACPGC